jgi:hypothetical protein
MKRCLLTLTFFWLVFLVSPVLANLGVGVGTGKIIVDQVLYPGTIYQLPPLTVINTGDEPSHSGVGFSHRETQPELIPDESWFSYSPAEFYLEPGSGQNVAITLTLPIKVVPGKYFGFLEGHPINQDPGGASIGIAAAAKLYFDVAPSSPLMGIFYRLLTFWRTHEPYSSLVSGSLAAIIVIVYISKNFNLKISKKSKDNNE